MTKDWTGNAKSTHATLGASNHSDGDRQEHDYYATDPYAAELLLNVEEFVGKVWEPACGEGHLSKVLIDSGLSVLSTDLIQRGYAHKQVDFLKVGLTNKSVHIITNPPYKYAHEFIDKSLSVVAEGFKVCMFLKLQFMEGKRRKSLFEATPPKVIYVSSSRIKCAKNGDFASMQSSAVAYAWYVWEKGHTGGTTLKWIN